VVYPPEGPAVGGVDEPEASGSATSGGKTVAALLLGLTFICLEFVAFPAILIGSLVHRDHPSGDREAQALPRVIGGVVLVILIALVAAAYFLARR
jgi:hypothetical protein